MIRGNGPDANAIRESVQRRRIRQIVHLTRLGHLTDIFRVGGLLSRQQLDTLGIGYQMSGWGSDQKAEEMTDYICCSVVSPWGMSSHEPETKALITLHPKLLWRAGTLFSGKWSSHSDVSLSTLLQDQTVASFDFMFDNETTNFPSPPPGEVLIPDRILVDDFLPRVFLFDEDAKERAINASKNVLFNDGFTPIDRFQFLVAPNLFRGNR